MITYVDTSSLLKLVVEEEGSEQAAMIWEVADAVTSASLVVVEGRAALAAAARGGRLSAAQHRRAKTELAALVEELAIVHITDPLLSHAGDLAEQEALRGYDAVHLAAALTVEATVLASSDTDLCVAARRQGLHVANPLDASSPG